MPRAVLPVPPLHCHRFALRVISGCASADVRLRPEQERPSAVLPGRPRLLQAAVLNSRRHLLTRDAAGKVDLWDVLSCRIVASYGVCDLEAKRRQLFEPVSVPAWFSCETNSGLCSAAMPCRAVPHLHACLRFSTLCRCPLLFE